MNFARLNHILIPETKEERDKWRNSRLAARLNGLVTLWYALTQEGRFVFVFWLVCGAVSLNVDITEYFYLWGILSGFILASLLVRRRFALEGVELKVTAPRRTAVDEEVSFTLELRNRGQRDCHSLRVEGPFLPWDGSYTGSEPRIPLLQQGETVRQEVKIRFVARGEHHLDVFRVFGLVPFGLAAGPGVESEGVRFLVVPRIASLRTLSVPLGMRYQPGGVALASSIGESRELVGIRPYRPGDPIRDLHAAAWARYGEPVVREYAQEYFSRVGVVLDTDGTRAKEEQFEAAVSLTAGVIEYLSRGTALIDLLVVGKEENALTLGRSLGFLDQALDLLALARPGPPIEPSVLEEILAPYLARLSSMVLVFLDWDEKRAALVGRLAASGVSPRILLVGKETRFSSPVDHGDSVTIVTPEQISGAEELFL